MADQKLVPSWENLCLGKEPEWPNEVEKIMAGQNMVGHLTNINVHSKILNNDEMFKVRPTVRNQLLCFIHSM